MCKMHIGKEYTLNITSQKRDFIFKLQLVHVQQIHKHSCVGAVVGRSSRDPTNPRPRLQEGAPSSS